MSATDTTFPHLTPSGQMGIFWRVLHLITAAYGNYPAGQLLIALTAVFLHERGMKPTLSDLCKATGLPKATVSRYVSWQLSEGFAKEVIDPNDRRRRVLLRTEKGEREWRWQSEQIRKLFDDVLKQSERFHKQDEVFEREELLTWMKRFTNESRELKRR